MSVSVSHNQHVIGWKSYRLLRKKAMEQELSWSGLVISLSIAFFIVAGSATAMRFASQSLSARADNNIHEHLLRAGSLARSAFGINEAQAAAAEYQAAPAKETEFITIEPGKEIKKDITFKNTGTASWKPEQVTFETGPYLKTVSQFQTPAWKKVYEPALLPKEVKPGQSVTISFALKAPTGLEAVIQENFQLVADNRPVAGSLVRLFVSIEKLKAASSQVSAPASSPAKVPPLQDGGTTEGPKPNSAQPQLCIATADMSSVYSQCNTSSNEGNAGNGLIPNDITASQPMIRVGLFSTLTSQRLTASTAFDIIAGGQLLFAKLPADTAVTVAYNQASRQYSIIAPSKTVYTNQPPRFVPLSGGIMTLMDYRVGQNPRDNRFRNIIEFRYTEPAKTVWLINELPIDDYIKGLGETTNASPVEFQKVMATASRTYVLYHYLRGVQYKLFDASTKHADDHFHVDATYDQVYRGYNSELRLTSLTQAVEATRGLAITYNSQPIIAAYFSNSDGSTRSYQQVWGGSGVPYLVSVPVPEDVGKTMYGHGVGMSARGALLMVVSGKNWQDVLKYFYTGTQVQKVY